FSVVLDFNCYTSCRFISAGNVFVPDLNRFPYTTLFRSIVENRQRHYLFDYFMRYSLKARRQVKTVTMDMYSPYISLVEACFPNRSEEHTSELQSRFELVCRLLLE